MADPDRLRVLFAGTPEFAARALQALLSGPHRVCAVWTQPDRPAGRGRQRRASAVKQIAATASLPVFQPDSLHSHEAVEAMSAWQADIIVVAAYGLMLPPAVLALTRYGCVNIHASLLPRWRGAAPIQRALLAGDVRTGISIMQMDEGLDTGDIWWQLSTPIEPSDTAGSLHDRLAGLGAEAIGRVLDALPHGAIEARPQPHAGVTYAHKISKADAPLNFFEPAVGLDRQIRAFNPWPVAETRLDGERLRIWASRLPADSSSAHCQPLADRPGTVVAMSRDAVQVATGAGIVELLALQRPGKRVLPAPEVARTLNLVGRVLESQGG